VNEEEEVEEVERNVIKDGLKVGSPNLIFILVE
jgi:hypothetical protein